METQSPAKDRIWFAQLLRGLACLIVVYSHLCWGYWLNPSVLPTANLSVLPDRMPPYPPHVVFHVNHSITHLSPGAFGVGLFFLISGFVIPISVERYSGRGFLAARFFRIFPVFWCALAINCTALAVYWSIMGNGFPYDTATVLANAGLIPMYLKVRWMDSVAWTLCLEVLFYLLCAAMMALGLFRTPRGVLATAAAVSALATLTALYYNLAFIHASIEYWPICNLASDLCHVLFMMVGLCFYRLYRREWSLRVSVAMTIGLLGLWYLPTATHLMQAEHLPATRRSYVAAYFCFGFCYLFRGYIPTSRPLNYLANISYPLYLVHPVVGYMVLTTCLQFGIRTYPAIALAVLSGFAIAIPMHHFVEEPVNRFGKRLAERWTGKKAEAKREIRLAA